ncbi:hypothetical protein J6590_039272 [Homalodisca vitripennis]|nr:hypothetical protein J6590_039272 [Homalodisca vitripennis]
MEMRPVRIVRLDALYMSSPLLIGVTVLTWLHLSFAYALSIAFFGMWDNLAGCKTGKQYFLSALYYNRLKTPRTPS